MDLNRKLAYEILLQVERQQAYANITINKAITSIPETEKAKLNLGFIRQLVYGTLENQILIDYIIDNLSSKGLKSIKKKTLVMLRLAVYQLMNLELAEYGVVNEMVNLSKKVLKGQSGFVNGILRQFIRNGKDIKIETGDLIQDLSIRYSVNSTIVALLLKQFGEQGCIELFQWWNQVPPLTIRPNLRKITGQQLTNLLIDEGFEVEATAEGMIQVNKGQIINSKAYKQGLFSVQDIPSKIIANKVIEGLDLGSIKVLDVCAAPGGKTFAIAECLYGTSSVTGCDLYEHRVKLMEAGRQRLDLDNVNLMVRDGCDLWMEAEGGFDAVLVDGPCSGLGVVRRKPEIKLRPLEDQGRSLANISLELLNVSQRLVKSKGRLVYSTCTINRIENQDVKQEFLRRNKSFKLVEERQILPMSDGLDGFYYAVFIKE